MTPAALLLVYQNILLDDKRSWVSPTFPTAERPEVEPTTFYDSQVKIGDIAGLVLGLGQEFELGLGPVFKVRVRRPSMVRDRVSVWVKATF